MSFHPNPWLWFGIAWTISWAAAVALILWRRHRNEQKVGDIVQQAKQWLERHDYERR